MPDMPDKSKTRAQFASVAANYRLSVDHTDADDREILVSRLAFEPFHAALDVATGGGHTAASFASRVRRVVASDLTPEMVREARTLAEQKGKMNIAFVAADAEVLPFRTGAFDRVTCRIAPHHFPDVCAAIAEMVRVTRPGGLVGIIDSVVPEDPAMDAFMKDKIKRFYSDLSDKESQEQFIAESWKEMLDKRLVASDVPEKSFIKRWNPATASSYLPLR